MSKQRGVVDRVFPARTGTDEHAIYQEPVGRIEQCPSEDPGDARGPDRERMGLHLVRRRVRLNRSAAGCAIRSELGRRENGGRAALRGDGDGVRSRWTLAS